MGKEHGRKYLLLSEQNAMNKGFGEILHLIINKRKYAENIEIDEKLNGFITNYFQRLVQQKQDNEEEKEMEQKEEKERKKREEMEKKQNEQRKDGDLDALSDDDRFDEEEY